MVKSKNKIIYKYKKQTGTTDVAKDKKLNALKPGKRVSKAGNVYYERRKNRSDMSRTKKL